MKWEKFQWSADFAYYVGLVWSDGYMSGRDNLISIELKSGIDEINLLSELLNKIEIGNISYRKRLDKRSGRSYDSISYNICNKKFYNILKKIGLHPAKSFTIEIPKKIPKIFFKDFLRGYFDGDGCIYYHKSDKSWNSKITSGSLTFLKQIHDYLKDNKIVNGGYLQKKKNQECYNLCFSKKDTLMLKKYLYYDGCLKLNRKFQRFLEAEKSIQII